jgi:hypothetical protein
MSNASNISHTVTTTSAKVLKENPLRKYAILVNNSDTVIYICLGQPASSTYGIRLNANGGNYEINSNNLWTGEIWAYCSASKNLLTTEF